jgi:hypothetical protein
MHHQSVISGGGATRRPMRTAATTTSATPPLRCHAPIRRSTVVAAAAADTPDAATPTRRSTLLAATTSLLLLTSPPAHAAQQQDSQNNRLNRYVKRKRLDPLASYVPALLLARAQLGDSGAAFAGGDPATARSLLRIGALDGGRESVRAVGQYATEAGQPGEVLSAAFLRELEALDAKLRVAERAGDGESSAGESGAEGPVVAALDALVATVPSATVERARQVVAGSGSSGNASSPSADDPALLEGLLAP